MIQASPTSIPEQPFPPLAPENTTFSVMRSRLLGLPATTSSSKPILEVHIEAPGGKGDCPKPPTGPSPHHRPQSLFLTPSCAFTKKYTRGTEVGRRKSGPTLYPPSHRKFQSHLMAWVSECATPPSKNPRSHSPLPNPHLPGSCCGHRMKFLFCHPFQADSG